MLKGLEKQQAEQLLREHAELKRGSDLEAWNIRAQTFVVFAAIKRIGSAESEAEIQRLFEL